VTARDPSSAVVSILSLLGVLLAVGAHVGCGGEDSARDLGTGGGDTTLRDLGGDGGASEVSATIAVTAGGGPDICPDTSAEPNGSEDHATYLGGIDDCNGDGSSVTGILSANDADWFRYKGNDTFFCDVDPSATVTANGDYRLCAFASCGVKCPSGTSHATSPGGRQGCCASNSFKIEVNCPGIDDDATVYLRLDKPGEERCVKYTLSYHY